MARSTARFGFERSDEVLLNKYRLYFLGSCELLPLRQIDKTLAELTGERDGVKHLL